MPFGSSIPIAANGSFWSFGNAFGLVRSIAASPNLITLQAQTRLAMIRPGSGDIIYTEHTGGQSSDITVAGPIINGRDQAAAFPNDSLIHAYYISTGATLAAITSLNPPFLNPSGTNAFTRNIGTLLLGPVLPTGFTHWAYAGAVPMNGAALMFGQSVGDWYYFNTPLALLTNGGAVVSTVVAFPTAFNGDGLSEVQIDVNASVLTTAGGAAGSDATLTLSGTCLLTIPVQVPIASFEQHNTLQVRRRTSSLNYQWVNDTAPANISARRLDINLSAVRNSYHLSGN